MPSIQNLKKQLRGVRSTQKLTKAMRTVSAAKFSRLNGEYGEFAEFARQCREVFRRFRPDFLEAAGAWNMNAPPLYVVMAGNKGLCGSFNAETLKFADMVLDAQEDHLLIACGKKAVGHFKNRGVPMAGEYVLGDEPTFEESSSIVDHILQLHRSGQVSAVHVVYPRYVNMLTQTPAVSELLPPVDQAGDGPEGAVLCEPDHDAFVSESAEEVFHAMFYDLVLQTALGAQAATLMTMRAAYDAATEYCTRLEGEISRKRQSAVTADVIETSSGSWAEG